MNCHPTVSQGVQRGAGLQSWLQRKKSEAVIADCNNHGCEQWNVITMAVNNGM